MAAIDPTLDDVADAGDSVLPAYGPGDGQPVERTHPLATNGGGGR